MPKVLKDSRYVTRRQRRRQIKEEYRKLCNTNDNSSIPRHIPATVCTCTDTKSNTAEFNNGGITADVQLDPIDSNNIALSEPIHENLNDNVNFSDSSGGSLPQKCKPDPNIDKSDLRNDLRNWVVNCCINHSNVNALLKILVKHGHDVPLDARTLLQTPRKLEIIDMSPGHYYHFGLAQGLVRSVAKYYSTENCPKELQININVDGLPLTKSSGSQFWPILASIETDFYTEPFIVGLYHGNEKPHDSNEFMKYFTEECDRIIDAGLSIGNKTVPIKINAFVSDTPAKCFITGTKGHNAYFGCGKCVQEGEFIDNRVTYPETTARLRTNESFRLKTNEEHHKKTSILENLFIDMILDFPIDYMHLVCLGVMKKLLQFWIKGNKDVRMTNFHRKRASDLLLSLNKSISKEFSRKARPLEEVDRFKATELGQLLLYTGPIVFLDNLPSDKYNHFLCLSVAIRILASPEYHIKLNDYARQLLQYFVESFPLLYGHQHVSYNVHNLIHLCNDVKLKGPLDKFSAFKFENYMQKIKKLLITSSKPLAQLIKRHQEECKINVQSEKFEYPIIKYANIEETSNGKKNIQSIRYRDFFISTKIPDNCCCLKDGAIIEVSRIHLENKIIYLTGQKFLNPKSFFKIPCESSKIGIQLVDRQHQLVKVCISNIKLKCLKFKLTDSENVVTPLLHHS